MPDLSDRQTSEFIKTLGGRIMCRQCTARSKRTQKRCQQPAMREKSVCKVHGARGGPKTAEGRARIAAAKTVHGRETRAVREERSKQLAHLSALEDLARALGMISGPRSPGRKPNPAT